MTTTKKPYQPGKTPAKGGLKIGIWELRTPGQIAIGEPLEISLNVFETG